MDMSSIPVVPPVPAFPNKMDQGLRMPSRKQSLQPPMPPRRPSLSTSGAVQTPTSLKRTPNHPHELLQTLFFGVYERRFINTTPTAILPSFFNMYFQQVNVTPPIDFPVPPVPNRDRELARRRKRNMMQRELGSAGLEVSQRLGMTLSRPSVSLTGADTSSNPYGFGTQANRNAEARLSVLLHPRGSIGPGTPNTTRIQEHYRQLKKTKSSPALNIFLSDIVSDNEEEEIVGEQPRRGSSSSRYSHSSSESPSSGNASLLPTPISPHPIDPRVEGEQEQGGVRTSQLAGDHGMDEFGISLAQSGLSNGPNKGKEEGAPKLEDEEEDARCAIMGQGGCFSPVCAPTIDPLKKDNKTSDRTLSSYTSVSSFRKGSLRSGTNSQWYEDDSDISRHGHDEIDMFNFLSLEEYDEPRGPEELDHIAAEELGLYDGLFYDGSADNNDQDVPEDVGDEDDEEGHMAFPYPPTNPAGIDSNNGGDVGSTLQRKRTFVRPRTTFSGHGMPVPSSLFELDDSSMGVHLTRAWTSTFNTSLVLCKTILIYSSLDVVACKEAMWEELQRRAVTNYVPQSADHASPNSNGTPTPLSPTKVKARRVTMLDDIQWVGSEQRLSDREKFELLFSRFEE